MRTFIIRARKGTTRWDRLRSQIGDKEHFEIVAHCVMNAFFISNGFRDDVVVYIILDSSSDFPRTIRLSGPDGVSIAGFHEEAIVTMIENALKNSTGLCKDQTIHVAKGIQVSGFGFEKLINLLITCHPIYLLSPKGTDIRDRSLEENAVFVLTDHLAMPKKTVTGMKKKGIKTISLGRKMLFASQCVVLINDELDRS